MRSLWIDPEQQRYPSLTGDGSVDVAIIGGGLTGLGAAYALRESGMTVALLEARTIGSGASGRNAGFLLAGPAMMYDRSVEQLGRDMAEQVWQFTLENNTLIGSIIDDWEIDCGFLRRGSLSLAGSEEEWRQMRACLECLRSSSVDATAVERQCLPRPFDRMYFGGIYFAGNAELDPGRFVRSLSARLAGGIRIHERTSVEAIEREDTWVLRTPGGRLRARSAIIATNAYTDSFFPRVPISPKRGQVLSSAPLDRVLVPFPMYASHGYQYWRQTDEGRLVIGGWRELDLPGETGTEETLHPRIQARLDDFSAAIAGNSITVEHRWAGTMGFTPDSLPLVGAVPGHADMWIAAGYSGHGVAMAFSCGARIAATGPAAGIPSTFIGTHGVHLPACFDPARFREPFTSDTGSAISSATRQPDRRADRGRRGHRRSA